MDITHLKETYPKLIRYMTNSGYSSNYIRLVKNVVGFITDHPDNTWNSYDDICSAYIGERTGWEAIKRKSRINLVANFDLDNRFPERRVHIKVLTKANKSLCPEFQCLLDCYEQFCDKKGVGKSTKASRLYAGRGFFSRLQEAGYSNLSTVTENDVLEGLKNKNGVLFSHRYCLYIKDILECGVNVDEASCIRIQGYIPRIRSGRKNIQYMTEAEAGSVLEVLNSDASGLSFREKAVGSLLLYTGLRRSDIAGLYFSSIDWGSEMINVTQQKTGIPVRLPLIPAVGNALYDYLTYERPAADIPYIFVTLRSPFRAIGAKGIERISNCIFDAAGIRTQKGDRRGTHIFRHRLVAKMLENDVPQPIITEILGHSSPRALDDYLNTDFRHLKECALSIEDFPVSREVFGDEEL